MKFRGRPSGDGGSSKTEEDLSPEALAKELADLQRAQAELTSTIDRLAGRIDSLKKTASAETPPAPSASSESPVGAKPSLAPPPPPTGFDVRAGSLSASASPPPPPAPSGRSGRNKPPPPPPPGMGAKRLPPPPPPPPVDKPLAPAMASAPPPAAAATKLSPLDRLLGEDFGKPRPRPSTKPEPPAITPHFGASDATPKEAGPAGASEPVFHVSPLLEERKPANAGDEASSATTENSAKSPTQSTPKSAAGFSFNTTLDQLRADEPSKNGQASPESPASLTSPPTPKDSSPLKTENAADQPPTPVIKGTESPAPDFFRSGGQSFASAAAMVNDILAATPDAVVPESGQPEAEESLSDAADEPSAPEIPITPDFFTAQPKKRFRLRR